MTASRLTGPQRTVLWWTLAGTLTLTAGEAEHVRRSADAAPGLCIGSSLLIQGTACPNPPGGVGDGRAMMRDIGVAAL